MVFTSIMNMFGGLITLAGAVVALIIVLLKVRSKARTLGVVGAILLIATVLFRQSFYYVLPIFQRSLHLSITGYSSSLAVSNVLFAIVQGVGLVLLAAAAAQAFKSAGRPTDPLPGSRPLGRDYQTAPWQGHPGDKPQTPPVNPGQWT